MWEHDIQKDTVKVKEMLLEQDDITLTIGKQKKIIKEI